MATVAIATVSGLSAGGVVALIANKIRRAADGKNKEVNR